MQPVTKRVDVSDLERAREERLQKEMALKVEWDDRLRLMGIAYGIESAGADLCGERVRQSMGIASMSDLGFPEGDRDIARSVLGVAAQPTVLMVKGPAEAAGVRPGDRVMALNGWPVPASKEGFGELVERARKVGEGTQALVVSRGGSELALSVSTVRVCDYPVEYQANSDAVNAWADGRRVMITRGMMRFAHDDTELALVVGHELAHNTMEHMKKKVVNSLPGALLDGLLAAYGVQTNGAFAQATGQAYSQDFESEADYVGLYLIARAGYPIEEAPAFWRRMAAEHPASIAANHASTHPATPQRFTALAKTVSEIREKESAHVALKPEIEVGTQTADAESAWKSDSGAVGFSQ